MAPERFSEEDDVIREIRAGRRDHFETVRRRKDGSDVEVSITVSPIADHTGTIVGASKIAREPMLREFGRRLVESPDAPPIPAFADR